MSDDEFDDFSIDDDVLNQIASIEKTADDACQTGFPGRTATSGSSAWSTSRKPLAGKAPAFQLRKVPLQGSSSSDSRGISADYAVDRHQLDRVGFISATSNQKQAAARNLAEQHHPGTKDGSAQSRISAVGGMPEADAIEVLSDDDLEFEICSPPAEDKTRKVVVGAAKSVKSNTSSAEAARIARANAIRSLPGETVGRTNWLMTAQNNRQNGAVERSMTKQTNPRNLKVAEWDPEKPQTQVVQTHLPFRPIAPKKTGKTWDRTAYSKSGQRVAKKAPAKKKGKKKKTGGSFWDDEASDGQDVDEEEEEDEEDGFDQFPLPFIDPSKYVSLVNHYIDNDSEVTVTPYRPIPPPRHLPLECNTSTYIYPINFPKREYQYEIVKSCFTQNTLVALPTGLGKTFIAGTVLLNFYRWFPAGKLVFLMPTKPLVNQQHEACQASCGIPAADAATITGDDPENWREAAWRDKRVFYATPQTFRNDMARGRVDPLDVVLVIVDEAHKATGNHSYVQCISYLMANHPHFRVVALTATPGRTPDKVQEIVDNLHISQIEIREAEAPEISRYMYKKNIYRHRIRMSDELLDIIDIWVQFMKPSIEILIKAGVLHERARFATQLKAFNIQQIARMGFANKNFKVAHPAMLLWHMTDALAKLMEYTTTMFQKKLRCLADESLKGVSKAAREGLKGNPEFRKLERKLELLLNETTSGADRHPKLRTMKDLIVKHFEHAYNAANECGTPAVTRCMVFCSFREGVAEIVNTLNEANPLIRAHKFVGRANASKDDSDKGLTQKEQKEVIDKFRKNDYNVLVSTSIGEEGLDIGEVDFIIIYNCPNSSIKMLQRVGRAGRKRDGQIHVFMTEGREDGNWDQALSSHQEMQSEIITGRNIELYDDVERLLPDGRDPTCVEQVLTVDPYEPEEKARNKGKRKSAANAAKTPKAKRARGEAVPEGALDGFVMASSLTKNGKKLGIRKKARLRIREDLLPGGGSETDSANDMTLSQLGRPLSEDSEEENPSPSRSTKVSRSSSISTISSRRKVLKAKAHTGDTAGKPSRLSTGSPTASKQRSQGELVKVSARKIAPTKTSIIVGNSDGSNTDDDQDPLGLLEAETPLHHIVPREKTKSKGVTLDLKETVPSSDFSNIDSRWMLDVDDDEFDSRASAKQKEMKTPSFPRKVASHSMPPPSFIPSRSMMKTPSTGSTPFVPVRKITKKRVLTTSSDEEEDGRTQPRSSDAKSEAVVLTSPSIPLDHRKRMSKKDRRNILVEEEVEVEGDLTMGDDLSGEESESDRRFAGQFDPTQAPQGFNQQAAYLAGLATQSRPGGPNFSDRAGKHDRFLAKARRPVFLSQEDRDPREGPSSEYEGSFVCGDDTVEFESDEDV